MSTKTHCRYCGQKLTKKIISDRKKERITNALRSREKARKNGTAVHRKRVFSYDLAKELYASGTPVVELAKILGVNISTVYRAIK